MKRRSLGAGAAVMALAVTFGPGASRAVASSAALSALEVSANFETVGVVVTIAGDTVGDAAVSLEIRALGEPAFRLAHPLVRVDATRFVGTAFDLPSGTNHEVRVSLTDPDGTTGGPTATAAVTTRADSLPEPSLRTLYVSTTGSDAGAGTSWATALRTIQEAANRSLAGDLILIAAGVYRERVVITRSGTAGQPIVFRGAGAGVVLDGADQAIAQGAAFTAIGDGNHSRVLGFATGHVVSDQGRLFRYDTYGELSALGAGAPGGFYFDGTTLFLRFADGSTPAQRTLHVGRLEDGFYLNGSSNASPVSFVRLEDLELRHYGAGDYGKGVYLRYCADCAVRRTNIHDVGAAGIWMKGGARNLIEDNTLTDTSIFGWPWPLVKGSSSENTGIVFTDDVSTGNVVRRNVISGFFNGIGPCGSAPPPTGIANHTDVTDNQLARHTDDAFEPEGHCADLRLLRNRITDVHMAFAVAPAEIGPTFMVRNVVRGVGNTRTSQLDGYTASVLKINSGYTEAIGPLFMYHNTVYTAAPNTNAMSLLTGGNSTYLRARNNALVGTRYVLDKENIGINLDWDYDLLHTTDAGSPARFFKWQGVRYDDLPSLQANTGQEVNGRKTAPGFTDAAAGNFLPAPGSPLLDAGVLLPGINDSTEDGAPDLGAIERAPVLFADGFESGDTSAWAVASGGG